MNLYICQEARYFMKVGELVVQHRYDQDMIDRYKKAIQFIKWERQFNRTPEFYKYNLEKRIHHLFDKLLEFLVPLNTNFDLEKFRSRPCYSCIYGCEDSDEEYYHEGKIAIVPIIVSHYNDRYFFKWDLTNFSMCQGSFYKHFGPLTKKIPLNDLYYPNNNGNEIVNSTVEYNIYNFYYFTWRNPDRNYQRREELRQLLVDYGMNYTANVFY